MVAILLAITFALWISRDIISHKNWHFYCGVHCIHIIKCRRSFYRCHDRDILLLLQNLQSCKENTKNRGAHFKENRVCSSNDSRGSNTTDVKVSKTCFSVPFLYCNVDWNLHYCRHTESRLWCCTKGLYSKHFSDVLEQSGKSMYRWDYEPTVQTDL